MERRPSPNFGLPIIKPAVGPDGDAYVPAGAAVPDATARGPRPAIGVYFACSNQYVRVYRHVSGEVYSARCPTCAKTIEFRVGPGGTARRMFKVSC